MIRSIVSTLLGLGFLYLVYIFLYTMIPESRLILDDMRQAIQQIYYWAVNQWGSVAVGGALLLIILAFALFKR